MVMSTEITAQQIETGEGKIQMDRGKTQRTVVPRVVVYKSP